MSKKELSPSEAYAAGHGSPDIRAMLSERQSFAAIQPKRFGLFVWHFDARYRMEEHIAGTAMYISQTSAEKAADAMNARGEHGGKVVVRTPLDGPK